MLKKLTVDFIRIGLKLNIDFVLRFPKRQGLLALYLFFFRMIKRIVSLIHPVYVNSYYRLD